jgi:hypothetical protein
MESSAYGFGHEVMFHQVQVGVQTGLAGFTQLKNVIIIINDQPVKHLLYNFCLGFRGWSSVKVVSYTAFA